MSERYCVNCRWVRGDEPSLSCFHPKISWRNSVTGKEQGPACFHEREQVMSGIGFGFLGRRCGAKGKLFEPKV